MTSNEDLQATANPSASCSRLLRAREMLGYAFGKGRIDVRGWHVYSSDAELAGSVHSLFVDIRTKAVRYLGVAIADRHSGRPTGTVLVPVGAASRPSNRREVVLPSLSFAQLAAAPRLPNRAITRGDEDTTLAVYGIAPPTNSGSYDPYASPIFAEQWLFGREAQDRHE